MANGDLWWVVAAVWALGFPLHHCTAKDCGLHWTAALLFGLGWPLFMFFATIYLAAVPVSRWLRS